MVHEGEDEARALLAAIRGPRPTLTHRRVATRRALEEALGEGWELLLLQDRPGGTSALELLAVVRERLPGLPVVVVAKRFHRHDALAAVRAGANDYVLEDDVVRLRIAVERALGLAERWKIEREVEQRFEASVSSRWVGSPVRSHTTSTTWRRWWTPGRGTRFAVLFPASQARVG